MTLINNFPPVKKFLALLIAGLPFASAAQTNACNNNANGLISVNTNCVYDWFDIDHNNDFWDGATGCGASDIDATWGYFVATATSTTITYNPDSDLSPGFDPIITILQGGCANNMGYITCVNNAGPDITESITIPTVIGNTYRIRVQGNNNSDWYGDLCVSNIAPPPPPPNATCSIPNPICSGSPISFIANEGEPDAEDVNPGNDYDCLFTSPNPSWYYLEIANPGNLVIDITAGDDVDYAIWGPFPNLANAQANCNSYGVPRDCSWSPSEIEQAVVTGVTTGQVYVLLVTNYANAIQTININEAAANTASTNCAIVPLPVGYTQWDVQYINRQVVLSWATEAEQNNEQFIVQRSNDGMIWETIGAVAGNGNSDQAHDYQYIDEKPLTGISYYRLMQVDFNGTPSYTSILSVNTNKVDKLTVYPNPTKQHFTVLTGKKSIEQFTITNPVGKSFPVTYTETEDGLSVDCSHLAPGIYTVSVVSEGAVQAARLVIEH